MAPPTTSHFILTFCHLMEPIQMHNILLWCSIDGPYSTVNNMEFKSHPLNPNTSSTRPPLLDPSQLHFTPPLIGHYMITLSLIIWEIGSLMGKRKKKNSSWWWWWWQFHNPNLPLGSGPMASPLSKLIVDCTNQSLCLFWMDTMNKRRDCWFWWCCVQPVWQWRYHPGSIVEDR